jgi:serine/threonine protein kinase
MYKEFIVRYVFKQIVKGVHYLHKTCGIVHLDLKLQNILLNDYMLPILTDFGFAGGVTQNITNWRGTNFHISPEMQELKDQDEKGTGKVPVVMAA